MDKKDHKKINPVHRQTKDLKAVGVRQDQMVPKVDGVHLVPIKDQVVGVLHQMGVGDRQAQWTDGDQDQEMGGDHLKEIDSVDPVEEEEGGDQGNSLV